MSANANKAFTAPKPPITITPAAALKSWELIQEEDDPNLKLRVAILGGGCHGFRYEFSFAEEVEEDDMVITETIAPASQTAPAKTVSWVVGIMSLQLLNGVEIDYESDLGGERFVIRNLKVKTTCSCGHSFSAAEPDEAVDA